MIACGRLLGKNPLTSLVAWRQAWPGFLRSQARDGTAGVMPLEVALIGHP